ncbi:MAG TPA: hypothetical protein VG713_17475 [Pirellulales bacterium]|nr:hypothetical protein [Pirellulales bacterium]
MDAAVERKRRRRNKSAIIREYLQQNPDTRPSAVVAALRQRKVKVSPTLVSNVRARMSAANERGAGKPRRSGRSSGSHSVSVSDLVLARKFADALGSINAALRALETLSKLSS